ncbi:MAG: hypothetical protein OXI89_01310 [Gemmatimonadota bacterium]|nr:hypothetical protein [Gemmatimonadota bacterium]
MTILKAGVDTGIGTHGMFRPNADEGRLLAHLLLLPAIERGMSSNAGYPSALRRDVGYSEPLAARLAAGDRRSAAHLLAMHAVHALSLGPAELRRHWASQAFRALQTHAEFALHDFGGGRR